MKVIDNDRMTFFDCDDTLIMWNKIALDLPVVTINGREFQVHTKHVQKIKDYHVMGFCVVVWSTSGRLWAKAVTEALGLTNEVSYVMSKPHRVFDDAKELSSTIKHGYIPLEGE